MANYAITAQISNNLYHPPIRHRASRRRCRPVSVGAGDQSRVEPFPTGTSLCPNSSLSNDLSPFGAFGLEYGSSLFRRIANRLETKRRKSLLDVRQSDDLDDLAMEQRGNLLGCSGWNNECQPSLTLNVGIAGFRHAWHV